MGEFEAANGVDAGTDTGTDHGQDDGFLARWSRRKSLARRESGSPNPAPAPVSAESVEAMPKAAGADVDPEPERLLTDADMPPVESLGPDSDYSGFLSRGVSEALRRKALARLFRSPAYNIVDGLDDYAEDFTKFAPLGDIVTADMRHQLEQRLKRLADAESETKTEADKGTGIDDSDDATRLSQVAGDEPEQPDQAEHSDSPKHPDLPRHPNPPEQPATSAVPGRPEHRHAGDIT
jgi:hypothetical protein